MPSKDHSKKKKKRKKFKLPSFGPMLTQTGAGPHQERKREKDRERREIEELLQEALEELGLGH